MNNGLCCNLDLFLEAMASETRQRILDLLQHGEMSVGEICEQLPVTQPTISHHLAILRRANLVRTRRAGQQVIYRANPACVTECCNEMLVSFNLASSIKQLSKVKKCGEI